MNIFKKLTYLFLLVLPFVLFAEPKDQKWVGYWDIDSSNVKTEKSTSVRKGPNRLPLLKSSAIVWIRIYQETISTQDLPSCNFHPSCSHFALGSVKEYGPLKGFLLAGDRLLRCNPFIKNYYPLDYGFDGEKFTDPVIKYD